MRGREQTTRNGAGGGQTRNSVEVAPGKRTLTEQLHLIPKANAPADAQSAGVGPARSSLEPGAQPIANGIDDRCIGASFAQSLSGEALARTIAHVSQRRYRIDLPPTERAVAIENLAALMAESERRDQSSDDRGGALRTPIRDAVAGARELASMLNQLAGNRDGLRNHPLTARILEETIELVTWVLNATNAGINLADVSFGASGEVCAPLVGMAVTRINAALVGLMILRPWCAFLQLHDRVAMLPLLQLEYRYRVLDREQRRVRGLFARLAGFDPDEVDLASATTTDLVMMMRTAFDEVIEQAERAGVVQQRAMQVQLAAELVTFAGGLRSMFAMRGPPSAMAFPVPGIAGASGGVASMGQLVVSAEWIAAIRHLVEIGAITAASAAEALRVRGFTSAMSQSTDLPESVKDLLGEGPTTNGMRVTNATGAGIARSPRHHVLPQERRAFFKERGFTDDLDIDNFTVELETAEHQAQHGGGNWLEGRKWKGEWNSLVMKKLEQNEVRLRRRMTVPEILNEVLTIMTERQIPVRFSPYRRG